MAVTALGQIQTFKAARDLSSHQYCPVYISAADTVDYATDSSGVIGILQNKPDGAGKAAEVLTAPGVKSKLKVDADSVDIAAGNAIECNDSHVGIKLTITEPSTTVAYLVGWALSAATEATAYITVLTSFTQVGKGS